MEEDKDMATQPTESGMPCKDVVLNPNVFTKFKLAGSQEVRPKCLTLACQFLPVFNSFWYLYAASYDPFSFMY